MGMNIRATLDGVFRLPDRWKAPRSFSDPSLHVTFYPLSVWLSRSSDSRAAPVLEDIVFNENDGTLAAIAALTLVKRGTASAADRLSETALEQDYIFQLDAGYALRKIGYEKAGDLSENLEDEDGKPVIDIETEYDGHLRIFPRIKGYRVANVFMGFQVYEFFT